MSAIIPRRVRRLIVIFALFILFVGISSTAGARVDVLVSQSSAGALEKVEPTVIETLSSENKADFFIWMAEKADLSGAELLRTKDQKGLYVFEMLTSTAERTQKETRDLLDNRGVDYQSFYIANKILVNDGSLSLLLDIAASPDVSRISANHEYRLQEPFKDPIQSSPLEAIESNITFIRANEVWSLGYDGSGIVLAGNDTGLDWDHPAIKNQYRGWNGSSVDHNYNWWDATGFYPTIPDDGHGHGTHTTGTMVGDDGGSNQIGVAPGAKTIHCKNMTNGGSGNDATFTECFEFDLAPWNLNGQNPDPLMAPDAVNNSWGYLLGGQAQFADEVAALQSAGILVEVSAGNEGPSCGSLRSPGDYTPVLTTGSVSHSGGSLPGTLTFGSSRGPSSLYPGDYFPDIMAPGEGIRSSLPGGTYASWGGTSMSGPHTTALIALMWEASPTLIGDIGNTVQAIVDTAVPLNGQAGSNCGGDYSNGPNNDWGYGTIDAYEAVQEALRVGKPFNINTTPDDQAVCTPANADYNINVLQVWPNFTDPVTLSVLGVPPGANASFNVNPVTPGGGSVMTVNTTGAVAGNYNLDVLGTAGVDIVTDTVGLTVFSQVPSVVPLVQPADAAVGVSLAPLLEWSPVAQSITYTVELAGDDTFSSIVFSAETQETSIRPVSSLASLTTYYWRVKVANICGTSDYSAVFSFTTMNQKPVLLVDDDDDNPDVRTYFEDALVALGYVYDIWDTNNGQVEPDGTTLANYDIVIWFSGDEFGGFAGPSSSAEASLASWLDDGGCLFLTAQDYRYDRGITDFMQDYLGVGNAASDVGHTVVTGSGAVYSGLGPYTLDYPYYNWSDLVEPDITAEVAFNGDMGNAGISKSTLTYLTTYLGFGLEAIGDVLDRRDVLNAFFGSCPDDPSPIVTIIDPLDSQTVSGTYRVLVEAYDDGTITLVDLTIDGGSSIDITTSFDGTNYYYDWDTSVVIDGIHTLQARATDNSSNSQDSALINVTVANNQPPVASFTYDCAGLNCSFDAGDSSDPEGDSLTYDWVFGDGHVGNGVTASHSYAFAGVYTVQLTVADSVGLTDTDSQQVIASEQKIHVADLDGFKSNSSRGRWNANVVITVYDEEGNLESGVVVDGDWSNGAGGSTLCTTGIGGPGQCQVTKSNLKGNVASVDFTIVSLTKGGYIYDAGSNADPDGDSNGTIITVFKDPQEPPPPPPPPGETPMHLAGLTGFATPAPKGGKWNANITVIVHGGDPDNHTLIQNIIVSGSWSGGITGGGSCTTNSSGTCTITKANIKANVSSVSFTIDGLADGGGTYFYNPPENHDGNGDPFPTLTVDILKP